MEDTGESLIATELYYTLNPDFCPYDQKNLEDKACRLLPQNAYRKDSHDNLRIMDQL